MRAKAPNSMSPGDLSTRGSAAASPPFLVGRESPRPFSPPASSKTVGWSDGSPAALSHVVFVVMPSPRLPAAATHYSAFENTELTWSGPITDFPLVNTKAPKPIPRGEPHKPLPPEGGDAFHPRQRIFTDPVHPNHPRQTLINSAAPLVPPKILPNLPNIVELQQTAGPARPRLQISQETLSKLRPREVRKVNLTTAPAPDLPSLDQKLADIAPSMLPNAPARPKLELNAGAAPRLIPRAEASEVEP